MRFIVLSVFLLLTACSPQGWNEKLSTPQERAAAERAIALLRASDVAGLRAMSDPILAPQLTPASLRPVVALTPVTGRPSLQTVAVNTTATSGAAQTMKAFNYELGAGDKWALIQIMFDTSGGQIKLEGFHVIPTKQQPSSIDDFTFVGKSAANYIWLVMVVLAVATTVLGTITAVRSPRFRKLRWLWIVGSLFSFVTFSLNWTTGAFGVMPISFLLFGAGAMRAGPLSPWVLSFAIPIVAIVILILARREQDSDLEEDMPVSEPV